MRDVVTSGEVTVEVTGSVTLVPGPLSSVSIDPTVVEVPQGSSQQFLASALDRYGNAISGLPFEWDVRLGVGEIDQDGRFSAALLGDLPDGNVLRDPGFSKEPLVDWVPTTRGTFSAVSLIKSSGSSVVSATAVQSGNEQTASAEVLSPNPPKDVLGDSP